MTDSRTEHIRAMVPGEQLRQGEQKNRPEYPSLKAASGLEVHSALLPQGEAGERHRADGRGHRQIKQEL